MADSNTTNPYQFCNDNHQQEQDQDEYRSRNYNSSAGILHDDYPSHQVQTSSNNGGHIVLAEASIQNQVQEGSGGIHLNLTINEPLRKHIELILTQERQQNNQQQLVSIPLPLQPPPKLKATSLFAVFLKIGSWNWEAKNEGDLVVKFYHRKKKLVWEFLFGPMLKKMMKKMEIRWTDVSAINAYVDDNKHDRLEIELEVPPEYYKECKFQPKKHTQWETTDDFTLGHAPACRLHTILFSPGVLVQPLNKLLQYDTRLFHLSRQPFPIHNSQFFNTNMELYRYSQFPLSNYDQQGINTVLPNSVQPTSSFVGHSGSNLPMPEDEIAREVCYLNGSSNGVLAQSGNNQIQDTPNLPPTTQQDDYELNQGLESFLLLDHEEELHDVNNQNIAQVNSTLKPFEQDQYLNNFIPLEVRTDGSSSSAGVMNYDHMMASIDDNACSFAMLQFNDELAFQEPRFWPSSDQYNMPGNPMVVMVNFEPRVPILAVVHQIN